MCNQPAMDSVWFLHKQACEKSKSLVGDGGGVRFHDAITLFLELGMASSKTITTKQWCLFTTLLKKVSERF
jgi:hypothetical protein